MGSHRMALIKAPRPGFCKCGTGARTPRAAVGAVVVVLAGTLAVAGAGAQGGGLYETWASESFSLQPRESMQMTVTFDQIQVRNWKLVVDGGGRNCDLNVRRSRDGSLLYQGNDQDRHEVPVPWGRGEEVSIVLTNRDLPGAFVVALEGPPRDQVHAAYSYHVNRALDRFAAGQRLAAEDECREALRLDPDDTVAKVLLAGFLRDRHYYDRAAALVDEALVGGLPEAMRPVAEALRDDLVRLRAPLPLPVRRGVAGIENLLADRDGAAALAAADALLDGELELSTGARGRVLALRGQALGLLDRNFEALDAFTGAMQLSRDRGQQATISFHMGRLFLDMGNLPQAEGAFTLALQHGLPSGLDVQARDLLQSVQAGLRGER